MVDRHHTRDGVNQPATTAKEDSRSRFDKREQANEDREDEQKDRKASAHKPFYRSWKVMVPLGVVILAVLVGIVLYWLYARQYEWTDDAFIAGDVTQIGPKVSGYVADLDVDDNQFVKADQTLFQIDPADYKAALAQAQAGLEAARSGVQNAKSQVALARATERSAAADVVAAQAAATNAAQVLKRVKLANAQVAGAVTPQELDQTVANARSTAANLKASQAKETEAKDQIAARQAELALAQSNVLQAAAQVRTAELNLGYTKVVAPVPGRVTHRTVEKGDYLQAGQLTMAIVPKNLWVVANFKETQLQYMKKGQPVTVRVDAYPDRELAAHVDSFQRGSGARFSLLPPENATGNYVKVVQRIPVKIVFNKPLPDDMILGPGMSVVPSVKVR